MTRVLVVDDQVLIRSGLAALLRATPGIVVVGEAGSGEEAVRLAAVTAPDVVLMDVRMPGMGGIAATERIAATVDGPAPKVLILTTFDLDEYVYEALRAGASGFLLKDTPPEQLLDAVAAVTAGTMLFAPSILRRLVEAYVARSLPGSVPVPEQRRELHALTAREREVLQMVGRGLSNAEIAGQLVISEATVKTHLNRAMGKLDLTSRAQAVVLAYETGLVTPRHRPD
ncbi:DNA-binding response regulator [Micromonospora qiuiae]|uniref:DNA-binding response regulator n=1 Tax=Micromonospora qiuiae TaxID=502268 RepID=A0ABQ4JCN9_9ACTN|nr:response regulator transcription factor [Micromonospora qiuiae]GIJ27946.1 DNA-binding response regulator [Micromonospora qiuiae]